MFNRVGIAILDMESSYNLRNPAVKRLMKEAEELRNPTEEYYTQPLEGNLFEWHFTVRGPPNTDFDGGVYHGRITLPPEYPMKPPSIILLTPNGRFEINKKICLSISGHHPESWQPSWSIRTALLAIIGFMPTHSNGAIGALDYTPEERQALAKKSHAWQCSECGNIEVLLHSETAGVKCGERIRESTAQITLVLPKTDGENLTSGEVYDLQSTGEYLTNDTPEAPVQSREIAGEANSDVTSTTTPTTPTATEGELSHTSDQVQSPDAVLPRLRVPHSDRQTDQTSTRIQHSVHRNPSVLPSAATSTTFIGILTFLIVFLLLRRLSTYVDCF